MTQHYLRLVKDNPMKIEISRFQRRFFSASATMPNRVMILLVLTCYALLCMLVVLFREGVSPVRIIFLQTGLFCAFGPMMLHGAVAGERERRSWELLLVAPVTKGQIVVGKFLGAMALLTAGAVAMLIPIWMATAYQKEVDVPSLIIKELVSISFCMLVCAWTIFISSRVKRPLMALGVIIGTEFVLLAVIPALVTNTVGNDFISRMIVLYLNPFDALGKSETIPDPYSNNSAFYGMPQTIIYLIFTVLFLIYAEKTLHFADNDVKFLPKRSEDAGS